MVFILRMLKAGRIRGRYKEYLEMKKMTIEDEEWSRGRWVRFKQWWFRKCPLLLGGRRKEPEEKMTKCEKLQVKITSTGTFENFLLKSFIGFFGGVLLTYMLFLLLVVQMRLGLVPATYISCVLGAIFCLGLAFSSSVRCTVLMALPQLFSKRGRQALIAYVFILLFTGPAKNTMRNMRILSDTMSCTQAKIKETLKTIVELIKSPFRAMKRTIEHITEKIKTVTEKVKALVNSIKKTSQAVLGVIKNAFSWLNSVVGMCSKKVGTPFQRCMKSFDASIKDCKVQLGSLFNWMCSVAYVASHLCYAVKVLDYVCELVDFVSDDIVLQAKKKLQEFMYQVRNIFYVSIEFSHSYSSTTDESKSFKEIAAELAREISERTSRVFKFFDFISFAFSFFFLWMIFKILNYRRRFLTNDSFDNRYLTENIIRLDIRRTQLGKETILPLNVHERKKYAWLTSVRLVKAERRSMGRAAVFLVATTVKVALHLFADYSIFWILNLLRIHGAYRTYVEDPGSLDVKVDGKGTMSELYASILNAFKPGRLQMDVDTGACLPDPIPPDFLRYKQILFLLGMAWLVCITEPYGLRLRFLVMSYYYPERAQVRAVWLYNNILRSRGSFLKYARRQLRRRFAGGLPVEEVSLLDRLRARFPLLRRLLGGKKIEACLLCGSVETPAAPLVRCSTPLCPGKYCVDCYAVLQNLCTICRHPVEYGDISDASEERDSSEDFTLRPQLKFVRPDYGEGESPEPSEFNDIERRRRDESGSDTVTDSSEALSYSYQKAERRQPGDVPLVGPSTSALDRSEAQGPRMRRATLHDLSEELPKRDEELLETLAERRRSSLLELLPTLGEPGLRQRAVRGAGLRDEEAGHGRSGRNSDEPSSYSSGHRLYQELADTGRTHLLSKEDSGSYEEHSYEHVSDGMAYAGRRKVNFLKGERQSQLVLKDEKTKEDLFRRRKVLEWLGTDKPLDLGKNDSKWHEDELLSKRVGPLDDVEKRNSITLTCTGVETLVPGSIKRHALSTRKAVEWKENEDLLPRGLSVKRNLESTNEVVQRISCLKKRKINLRPTLAMKTSCEGTKENAKLTFSKQRRLKPYDAHKRGWEPNISKPSTSLVRSFENSATVSYQERKSCLKQNLSRSQSLFTSEMEVSSFPKESGVSERRTHQRPTTPLRFRETKSSMKLSLRSVGKTFGGNDGGSSGSEFFWKFSGFVRAEGEEAPGLAREMIREAFQETSFTSSDEPKVSSATRLLEPRRDRAKQCRATLLDEGTDPPSLWNRMKFWRTESSAPKSQTELTECLLPQSPKSEELKGKVPFRRLVLEPSSAKQVFDKFRLDDQ